MTTSADTEVTIIEEPRSIDVLLKCSTYQGMSDAEIQSLIDYQANLAASNAVNDETRRANDAALAAMREHWREQAATAEAAFNAAVMSTVNLETYNPKEAFTYGTAQA